MSLSLLNGEQTNPENIAGVLEKLKKNLASPKMGESPKVRSTLSNFILLYGSDKDTTKNSSIDGLLLEVAKCHPSRFFVIQYDSSLAEPLTCAVKSSELKNSSGISLQTEEIFISVGDKGVALVKNLILSHLVPDIETVLVFPKYSQKSEKLNDLTFQILPIVDSFICEAPDKYLRAFIRDNLVSFRSKYLAWLRIARWRNAISEQFDATYSLQALEGLERISIEISGTEIQDETLFLVSWILDCLGYRIDKNEPIGDKKSFEIVLLKEGRQPAILELSFNAKSGLCGISKIGFYMQGDHGKNYVIESSYNSAEHTMQISTYGDHNSSEEQEHETCEFYVRKVNCEALSESELVVNLLRSSTMPSHSETFLQLNTYLGR